MSNDEPRRPATIRNAADQPPPETDWDAEYAAQQSDPETGKHGFLDNGAAKIGCGCVLPALFLFSSFGAASSAFNVPMAIGAAFGTTILIWGLLFAFWLRHAPKWIWIGSLIAIFIFIGLVNIGKFGQQIDALEKDAKTVANVQFDKDGMPIIPKDMDKAGPMSKIMVGLAEKHLAIARRYEADLGALRLETLGDAGKLSAQPAVLSHCPDIGRLKDKIEAYRSAQLSNVKAVSDEIDASDLPDILRSSMRKGYEDTLPSNMDNINLQWDTQRNTLKPLQRMCEILARRKWRAKGSIFEFTSGADMQAYNAATVEVNRQQQLLQKQQAEHMLRVKAKQDEMNKMLEKGGTDKGKLP